MTQRQGKRAFSEKNCWVLSPKGNTFPRPGGRVLANPRLAFFARLPFYPLRCRPSSPAPIDNPTPPPSGPTPSPAVLDKPPHRPRSAGTHTPLRTSGADTRAPPASAPWPRWPSVLRHALECVGRTPLTHVWRDDSSVPLSVTHAPRDSPHGAHAGCVSSLRTPDAGDSAPALSLIHI